MDTVLKTLADNESRYFRELAEFVAIPSVSTDPAHSVDVRRAADWMAVRLRKAGPIDVETRETPRDRHLWTLERLAPACSLSLELLKPKAMSSSSDEVKVLPLHLRPDWD